MKYHIEIDAEYATEFQEYTHLSTIKAMLSVYKDHVETSHKKNSMEYKITKQ